MAMDGRIDRSEAVPQGAEAERLRAELQQCRSALQRLERRFAVAAAEASVLRDTLAAVYASHSWRLTAPLRAAVTWRPSRPRRAAAPRQAAPPLPLAAEVDAAAPRVSLIVLPPHADPPVAALRRIAAGVAFEVLLPRPEGAAGPPAPLPAGMREVPAPAGASTAALANAAAAAARGERIALWDAASPPLPGWLAALDDCFAGRDGVGMAGATLLDATGRIAAAGATIAADGRLLPLGAGAAADHPDHAYLAEVAANPLGCVMLPAALWRQMGGLDEEFGAVGPALTDLGLRLAAAGYGVVCTPFARLRAPPAAAEDWAAALGRRRLRQLRAAQGGGLAALAAPPPRVLFVDHFVPTPDRDFGSADLHAFLRIFVALGYHTTLLPLDDLACADAYAADLRRRGVRVAAGGFYRSLGDFLGREAPFDLFMVYRGTLAQTPLLSALRRHSPQARLVFNTVDLHFLRLEREALLSRSAPRLDEAFRMQQRELAAILGADCTILLSAVEQRLVGELLPGARTWVIPIARDIPGRTTPFAARRGAAFVGSFRHRPNADAIAAFVRDVWPLVRQRLDITLTVIGADPPPEVQALAGAGVVVAGHVADLDAALAGVRLTVAPLRFGAGLKGKIVSSLAAGVPCVASPVAAEGMALVDGEHVRIAAGAAEFAAAVIEVHEQAPVWERLSEAGLRLAREQFSLPAAEWRIAALLDELGLPAGRDPDLA